MIDKLEIRVPHDTPFGPELNQIQHDLRRGFPTAGFRPTQHYALSGDLRPFGIQAIVHLGCKHGNHRDHKLELLDTGTQPFSALLNTATRVFHFDPRPAGVMRCDCAADVPNVPVSYFENTAYVRYKRSACDIGDTQQMRLGGASIETLYLGKKPNCIRIYNKPAQCLAEYRQLKRKLGNSGCALPFERIYGFAADCELTRVERQIAGARVPPELATVADVQRNAAEFNPFAHLEIHAANVQLPRPQDVGLARWLQGMKLRELRTQWGMQRLKKFLNRLSKGNASRICDAYADFFIESGSEITADVLCRMYQESVRRQIEGNVFETYPGPPLESYPAAIAELSAKSPATSNVDRVPETYAAIRLETYTANVPEALRELDSARHRKTFKAPAINVSSTYAAHRSETDADIRSETYSANIPEAQREFDAARHRKAFDTPAINVLPTYAAHLSETCAEIRSETYHPSVSHTHAAPGCECHRELNSEPDRHAAQMGERTTAINVSDSYSAAGFGERSAIRSETYATIDSDTYAEPCPAPRFTASLQPGSTNICETYGANGADTLRRSELRSERNSG